jgi:hypothetical protein
MASSMVSGRARIPIPQLLQHDIQSEIALWLALTVLASFLSGFVVARAIARNRSLLRISGGVVGGLLPLTWYVTGYAFQFGFVNVTATVVVLLCIWLVWLEGASRGYLALCVLVLSTTVMLAVWAPLAVIPVGLGIAAAIMNWRELRLAFRWPSGLVIWLAVVQLIAYVLLLTIPDFGRDGGALGAGGAMVPISPTNVVFCAVMAFAVTAIAAVGRGDFRSFVGVSAMIVAATVAILYLSSRSAALGGWGYFAAKLGWMLTILALTIIAGSIGGWLKERRAGRVTAVGVLASAALVPLLLAAQVQPGGWNIRDLFPEMSIGRVGGTSAQDAEASMLFSISDPRKKSIVVGYFPSPAADLFVNGWLLQQPSKSGKDALRTYAYYFDTTKPADVCKVINVWGGGVDVYTRDPKVQGELKATCPSSNFKVILRS